MYLEDNIKMYLNTILCEGLNLTEVAQNYCRHSNEYVDSTNGTEFVYIVSIFQHLEKGPAT